MWESGLWDSPRHRPARSSARCRRRVLEEDAMALAFTSTGMVSSRMSVPSPPPPPPPFPVLLCLPVLPSLKPLSGLIPSLGQTSQPSPKKPYPERSTASPMPSQETACSPNKLAGRDEPAYTQGHFLKAVPLKRCTFLPVVKSFGKRKHTSQRFCR